MVKIELMALESHAQCQWFGKSIDGNILYLEAFILCIREIVGVDVGVDVSPFIDKDVRA